MILEFITIKFNIGKKPYIFRLWTDYLKMFPLKSLENAITSWAYRTTDYSEDSFIAYVQSKKPYVKFKKLKLDELDKDI